MAIIKTNRDETDVPIIKYLSIVSQVYVHQKKAKIPNLVELDQNL